MEQVQYVTVTKEGLLVPAEEEDCPPPPPQKSIFQELPPHWKQARDSSGHVYYYNSITKETQWHLPKPVPPTSTAAYTPGTPMPGAMTYVTQSAATISSSTQLVSSAPSGSSNQDNSQFPYYVFTDSEIQFVDVKEENKDGQSSSQSSQKAKNRTVKARASASGKKPQSPGQFQCQICNRAFKRKRDLVAHKGNAGNDVPLVCSVCHKGFCSKKDLSSHMRKHKEKRPGNHKCTTCGKVYRRKIDLAVHMKNKPSKCLVCDLVCCTKRDLAKHFDSHVVNVTVKEDKNVSQVAKTSSFPSSVSPDKSDIAGETSDRSMEMELLAAAALASGVQNDSSIPAVSSSVAAGADSSKNVASASLSSASVSEAVIMKQEERFPCPTCKRMYKSKRALIVHLENREGELECSVCQEMFCTKPHLCVHMFAQHPGIRPHKCDTCHQEFPQKQALDDHLRIGCVKMFKCTDCEKSFESERRLQIHNLCHKGETILRCTVCDKLFKSKSHLRTHSRIHTGEKPFQCATCGKRFLENGALTKHARTHTGERPYKCTHCEKTFSASYHLLVHVRAKHTQEKLHQCVLCTKSFSSSWLLKTHLRKHTVEKMDSL